MNIKKIKEYQIETLSSLAIDWECGTKDPNSEWINLKDHLQVVKELEEKLESLKCCCNCKYDNTDTKNNGGCFGCKQYVNKRVFYNGYKPKEQD